MAYPVISKESAQAVVDELLQSRRASANPLTEICIDEIQAGVEILEGPDYPRDEIEGLSSSLLEQLLPDVPGDGIWDAATSRKARAELEAKVAGPLHASLSGLPVGITHDPDFWRYLALFPFRWFLLARESELKPVSFGGVVEITDAAGEKTGRTRGTAMRNQLLLRTYLWGRAAYDPDADEGNRYQRATALSPEQAVIDFWHSHIVRVQIGHLDPMTQAFIDLTASEGLSKDEARELAKMLSRAKNTVAFDTLSLDEAGDLVAEQLDLAKQRLSAE